MGRIIKQTQTKTQTEMKTKASLLAIIITGCVTFNQMPERMVVVGGNYMLTTGGDFLASSPDTFTRVKILSWDFLDSCIAPGYIKKGDTVMMRKDYKAMRYFIMNE